jgi:sterol desaturase/sphingolipid hydroxylase (fatty acid hydroxylase superfamily)
LRSPRDGSGSPSAARRGILSAVLLVGSIAAIMALDTVLLVFLAWAFSSPRFAAKRISPMPPLKVSAAERLRHIVGNSTLSLVFVVSMVWWLSRFAFRDGSAAVPAWRIVVDALAVIVIYDFLYYALHRGLHHKKLMPLVHAVHHRARNPSALESFYLHPVELFAGLALMHVSVALFVLAVGQVHVLSYAIVFLVHSTLNILVHSGLVFGRWFTGPIDLLARKHSVHHKDDFKRNYASLTPIPDMIFGTAR